MEYPKYYKILELPVDAETAEIKKQYRKLAKKYHPDMNPNDKTAEDKFKQLKEAYEVLIDEAKRAAYDMEWKKKRAFERKSAKSAGRKKEDVKKKSGTSSKTSTPSKKKETSVRRKTKKIVNFKTVLIKILRIFLTLTLVSLICFSIAKIVIESGDKAVAFGKKIWGSLSDLGEIVSDYENYLLKHEVVINDVEKAQSIILEKREEAANDENIINIKNSDGYSLLMLAKTAEMSKMLIENGAEINYMASDGMTALLAAVQNNNFEQVKVLLEAGANPEVVDRQSGYSALMIAQREDIAYLLLKFGANPNFIAANGTTALSKAATEHNRNRLNLLQQFGAQINWSDVIRK